MFFSEERIDVEINCGKRFVFLSISYGLDKYPLGDVACHSVKFEVVLPNFS